MHHLLANIFIGSWLSIGKVNLLVVSYSDICQSERVKRWGPVPETSETVVVLTFQFLLIIIEADKVNQLIYL